MITIRRSAERGHFNHGWLDSHHTFSFADYYDPAHMSFRSLRVMNEDVFEPGRGFGMHPHRDMEIVTYVMSGAVEHKDSMGNSGVIRPGELQRMSAGTGVMHSEFAASEEPLHLYQIWILPERNGIEPGYEQRAFPIEEQQGRLRLTASRDGREGSLTIHTDASIYAGTFAAGETASFALAPGRHAWLQVARGSATLNGQPLETGDGAAISGETDLGIASERGAEVLLFDLA